MSTQTQQAIPAQPNTKTCTRCARDLPHTVFARWTDSPDGRYAYCRECAAILRGESPIHVCPGCKSPVGLNDYCRDVAKPGERSTYCGACEKARRQEYSRRQKLGLAKPRTTRKERAVRLQAVRTEAARTEVITTCPSCGKPLPAGGDAPRLCAACQEAEDFRRREERKALMETQRQQNSDNARRMAVARTEIFTIVRSRVGITREWLDGFLARHGLLESQGRELLNEAVETRGGTRAAVYGH